MNNSSAINGRFEYAGQYGLLALILCSFCTLAQAQSNSGEDFVIEEIIVTAQKREQSILDVPLAVTAITSKELKERSVIMMEDALGVVPNLTSNSNVTSNIEISIRGVNTSTNNIGLEAGVGMQVDGVPLARPSYMNVSLFDVERIEVLRGPQGTLYGKNTTGGLINVVTARPQQEFSTGADLTFGDYNLQQFRGHITGGSETVKGRLAVSVVKRDGWAEDRTPGQSDFMDQDFTGARAHLLFEPNDKFSLLLSGFYGEDDANENFQDIQGGALYPVDGSDGWDRSIATDGENFLTREMKGVSATIDYRFDNGLTLTSITASLENDTDSFTDQDYSILDIFGTGRLEEQEQLSQEFRLTSNNDGVFNWVAGVYYIDQSQNGNDSARLGEFVPPAFGAPFIPGYEERSRTKSTIDGTSIAGFVSASWAINDRWTLEGGLRYTKEDKDLVYSQEVDVFEVAPGVPVGIILALVSPIAPTTQSISNSEPSGDISLSYAASDNVNIYGRLSHGFKAGGFDSTLSNVPDPGDLAFSPEFVNSFEIGIKSLLAKERVQLNVAAFYLDWEDKQEQEFNGATFVTGNAASATNQGLEVELQWLITQGLRLSGALGLQDGSYDTFIIEDPFDPLNPDDRSGNKLPLTPDTTGMLALDYTLGIGNWSLYMRGEAIYSDANFTGSDNDPRFEQIARTNVNARIGISSPDDHFGVAVWGRNLTEEDYVLGGFEFFGTEYASVSAPRMYGAEFRVNF